MAAERKARTSYSAGLATRELILATATEMLAEYGYFGITLRDLARRIGISHPAVIYHFPNKEALVEAAILCFEERIGFLDVARDEETGRIVPVAIKPKNYVEYAIQLMRLASEPDLNQLLSFSAIVEYEAVNEAHPLYYYANARRALIFEFIITQVTQLGKEGVWQYMVDPMFLSQTLATLWIGTVYQSRTASKTDNEHNGVVAFLATAVVLLKIAPGELLDFSGRVPEELANVYVRVMRHVSQFLA